MPQEHLDWLLAEVKAREAGYTTYQAYYDGDHPLVFATEKFINTFGPLFARLADNLAATVVDAIADRLQVRGFSGAAGQAAEKLWGVNRMAQRHGEVHLEAGRSGDSYVLVWPDSTGTPRMWPQRPNGIAVAYDAEDDPSRLLRAGKLWKRDDGRWRANIYYPDAIERWVVRGGATADQPDKASQFVEWTEDDSGPRVVNQWDEVPMKHFPNNAPPGSYGTSELRNVTVLNDALNKALADMLVAMEYVALPQRWATGIEPEYDPVTNRERQVEAGADRLLRVGNDRAAFGQFPAADLTQFLRVQDSFRIAVARASGTPLHYFLVAEGAGGTPSGEALKTLEVRLVRKIADRQAGFGDSWRQVVALGLRQAGAGIGAEPDIETDWESGETRDELREVEVQEAKLRIHRSPRRCLVELGYDETEIEKIMAEREEEAAAAMAAQLAAFDRGQAAVESSPFVAA